jgi:ADP-heptose:LPS heptosyltransferase
LAKKILVIRFSSIGDIVLTTPVVRALHQQLGAEVHFLTKMAFAPIVQCNPHIVRVFTLSDDFSNLIRDLKQEEYDYIIDLHHNIRTKRMKIALGKPSSSFYKLNFEKWLLVHTGVNRLPDVHIVDRYMETVAPMGAQNDELGLDWYIPENKKVDIGAEFGVPVGNYVAFVVGAAHATKCLTTDQIISICHQMKSDVILLGGKDEMDKANQISASVTTGSVKNGCGRFDIFETTSILQQAGSVITHDTGLMHIAAALQKHQVVVWGNTIPEFGMYPYYGKALKKWISFEQQELTCRPCSKLGFPKCPKSHFKCMLGHDLKAIAEAAESLIV